MKQENMKANLQSSDPTKARALRTSHSAASLNIGNVHALTSVQVVKRVIADSDGEFGIGSKKGDAWWYTEGVVVIGSTASKSGWLAEIHKGERLMDATILVPKPPLPATGGVALLIDLYPAERKIVITSSHDLSDVTVVVEDVAYVKAAAG